jgi:hypothetical protein
MAIKEFFAIPARYRTWSLALMGVGILSVIIGFVLYGTGHHAARFWATMLQNSVFFLLVTNAAMFFICATTLAWGGWQLSFRRVTEAVSVAVIPLGIIAGIVLLCLVLIPDIHVFHWLEPKDDKILLGKSAFLNRGFFITWTILSIGLWIVLGYKMRQLSRELDTNPLPDAESGRKYIFKNNVCLLYSSYGLH